LTNVCRSDVPLPSGGSTYAPCRGIGMPGPCGGIMNAGPGGLRYPPGRQSAGDMTGNLPAAAAASGGIQRGEMLGLPDGDTTACNVTLHVRSF